MTTTKQKLVKVTKRKKPAADEPARLPRGICPVCGVDVALTKDGSVRTHHVRKEGGALVAANAFSGNECKGIGEKPKPNGSESAKDLEDKSGGPLAPVAKQLPIPGTEEKTHKDIDEAAEHLASAKESHASAGKLRKLKEDALIFMMKKHKRTHYVNRGLNIEIFLEASDRVRLKQFNHDDENDE